MDLLAGHWEQPVISHKWQPLMKLNPGSASQLCLFHKVLARAQRCHGLPSPENGVMEQQNADNELLCLCCLFVITHVSDKNIKMRTWKVVLATVLCSVTAHRRSDQWSGCFCVNFLRLWSFYVPFFCVFSLNILNRFSKLWCWDLCDFVDRNLFFIENAFKKCTIAELFKHMWHYGNICLYAVLAIAK